MLVYFQIGPPSSLDLGGEQDMWGSTRTVGGGLPDGMLGGPGSFLQVTSKTRLKFMTVGSLWGCGSHLVCSKLPNNRKSFLFKMVLKFQQMPHEGFAI